MQSGLVSVIIPVYNSAGFIRQAIDSVLKQTYTDFEIIVVNDGSPDNSEEIVLSIKDKRIRYIKTENQGNYFARNTGIGAAGGAYIAFLDHDDLWLGDKLEKQIMVFNREKETGFCCTDHQVFFYQNKEKLYIDRLHTFSGSFSQKEFIEKLIYDNFIITSSVMVRKSCLDHLGKFDTHDGFSMDYDLWLRIALNYSAHYIGDRLVLKGNHPSSITSRTLDNVESLLYTFNKTYLNIEKNRFFEERQKKLISEKIRLSMYTLGIEYLCKKDYENALKHLTDSHYTGKPLFRHIAILLAKFRAGAFIPLVKLYRSLSKKKYLMPVPDKDTSITTKIR